jgi:mono/diheme cytochrome c family protein
VELSEGTIVVKKKHLAYAGIVVLVVVAATTIAGTDGPAVQTAADSAQPVAEGREIYTIYCVECHGIDGEGEYPDAPLEPGPDGLMGAPPHDDSGHTWHHSDDLLIQQIREGRHYTGFKPMPGFGDILTDSEIEAVLAYIKTMWTEEQRDIQTGADQPRSDVPSIRELAGEEEE